MTICTFIGHGEIRAPFLAHQLDAALEALLATDTTFLFYTGATGPFDDLCADALRRAKHRHPELQLQLAFVPPAAGQIDQAYMDKVRYDAIVMPESLKVVSSAKAVKRRNQWMANHASVVLAFVPQEHEAACEMLRYAKNRPDMRIVNLAQQGEMDM